MANGTRYEDYFLTAKEAAEYLRINVKTLYAWAAQKKGPPMYRLQRRKKSHWRISRDKLDQWIETKNKE